MEDLYNIFKEILKYQERFKKDGLKNLNFNENYVCSAMDCATRIFNSQNISKEKKSYQNPPKQQPEQDTPESATDKQKAYLEKIEYGGEIEGLSKQEASALISKYIESKREKK